MVAVEEMESSALDRRLNGPLRPRIETAEAGQCRSTPHTQVHTFRPERCRGIRCGLQQQWDTTARRPH